MKKRVKIVCLVMMGLVIGFAFGCAQKDATPEPKIKEQSKQEKEEKTKEKETAKDKKVQKEKTTPSPTPMEKYEQKYAKLPTQHKVKKGECLWWIAEDEQIYNDPFMWPLIYKANKDKIEDPDLIYPQQDFEIPRHFQLQKLKQSRKSAGAPSPYKPQKDANISAKLKQKLGWDF